MAESVVQFLIKKISSLLQEEATLLSGVRKEAEDMRDELERMTAFLRVAETGEQSDPELKVWVNQVRDVAHDTDDLLDKFIIRFAHHDHGNGLYGHLSRACSFVKNLKASSQIASEIQSLKSRVTNIGEGRKRYRVESFVSKPSSSSNLIDNTLYDRPRFGLLSIEADLVGIDGPKQQLVKWLVGGECSGRLKCVSVVGMGGCGKTTLVQQVYCDTEVKQHFHCHLWLIVSESYNLDELLRKIIQQLVDEIREPASHSLEAMDTIRLKALIDEFLKQRRYLIVIDDVWDINTWEAVRHVLPENNFSSRVMLTTRFSEIASKSRVDTNGNIYSLKPLSKEESWALFLRRVFRGNPCPQQLEEISQSILKRCEGLPLAIVTISGVLATRNMIKIFLPS